MTHPEKQDRIGPWQSADYHRFCELCCDGYGRPDGELLRNTVYQWLKQQVPSAVAMTDGESPELPYKRMLIVAQHIIMAMQEGTRVIPADEVARARKWHKKVQAQIKRLQKTLGEGPYLLLPGLDKQLAAALPLLDTQATKAAQPWLWWLARELHRETGSADVQLLLNVAGALELDFDERTAQRYVKEAREAGDR